MWQIKTLRRSDDEYPRRLQALEMAPEQLHLLGTWDDARPTVAIVGSRAASAQGMATAHRLAAELAGAGVAVLSGGAIGVDHAAHCGALAGGGVTCAVLGTGVDVVYPLRHQALYRELLAKGGCLLSMFPLATPPKPWHFPARNRVLAALADAVVVVEAQARSGSCYTAQAALALGRRLLAVPGSPGTAALLSAGALVASGSAAVLAALGLAAPACGASAATPDTKDTVVTMDTLAPPAPRLWETDWTAPLQESTAAQVRRALDQTPRDLGELSARSGLPAATCAAVVVDLELRGQCTRLSGGRYMATLLGGSARAMTPSRGNE